MTASAAWSGMTFFLTENSLKLLEIGCNSALFAVDNGTGAVCRLSSRLPQDTENQLKKG